MAEYLLIYESYLKNEKKASANTVSSYLRDLNQFNSYLSQHTCSLMEATSDRVESFSAWLDPGTPSDHCIRVAPERVPLPDQSGSGAASALRGQMRPLLPGFPDSIPTGSCNYRRI